MSQAHRRAVAGLLLVAALGGAVWLAGFAPHTDDGCQTEIHCLACRSAYTRPALLSTVPGPVVALAPSGAPAPVVPVLDLEPAPSTVSSRGPPLPA